MPIYKVYTALLDQSGTGDPAVGTLEDTIGIQVWTRGSQGNYSSLFNSSQDPLKIVFPNNIQFGNSGSAATYYPISDGATIIGYYTLGVVTSDATTATGIYLTVVDSSFVAVDLGTLMGTTQLTIDFKIYP